MADAMATVPVQLLGEVEAFISTHRGITFKEAESAVMALRTYRQDGAMLHSQYMERITKLQDEVKLLHEKLEANRAVDGN